MKILINKILMTTCVATIFFAMFYMGSSEEKRSLRHLAIYDTVSVEEYKSMVKEYFKEFSLCRCIDYGITGYDITREDGYLLIFYSSEGPDAYAIEIAILDSCAKEVADSIPRDYFYNKSNAELRKIMLTCIDYYKSEKLDSLITKLVEEKKELHERAQKEHYKRAKEDLKDREQWEKEQKELNNEK